MLKKFKSKFKKKLNNQGSSIVMVVACIGFIGIVIGALLSAASYAYKLKMQDLNAKDNFYYVEQALNEIYAGVGTKTVESMQEAYLYTVENMVYYDVDPNTPESGYTTLSQDDANRNFRQRFLSNISGNDFFSNLSYTSTDANDPNIGKKKIAVELEKLISNDTVKLKSDNLYVETVRDDDGNIEEIIIRNLTLERTQEYNKNSANGSYTQTITTNIVISEPNFNVSFSAVDTSYSNIYDYAMVAENGIQIDQTTALSIVGNIYGASDYYNKRYNESSSTLEYENSYTTKEYGDTSTSTADVRYAMNKVTNSSVSYGAADGVSDESKYSGLYINNGSVSILAETVIVPGSISIMNSSSLVVYGKSGLSIANSEVWADDIVLDSNANASSTGPTANIYADTYILDDTELNAENSKLTLSGSYFGYGNSTRKNNRYYTNSVTLKNFKEDSNSDGDYTNEDDDLGHYNSSAIIVNGKSSTLDISQAKTLYLAGRTYIELSRYSKTTTADDGTTTSTYVYDSTIKDYKTGESLSVKSNQLAYIPVALDSTIHEVYTDDTNTTVDYYTVELSPSVVGTGFYSVYFPANVFSGNLVPCIYQKVGEKESYYYNFDKAYELIKNMYDTTPAFKITYDAAINSYYGKDTLTFDTLFPTADDFAAAYIVDYAKDTGVTTDSFTADLVENEGASVYASGAITSKAGTAFNLTTKKDFDAVKDFLEISEATYSAFDLSNDYSNEYEYMKWNLGHYSSSDLVLYNGGTATDKSVEEQYIDDLISANGIGWITPINKFLNIDQIDELEPTLASGNVAIASKDSVTVSSSDVSGEVKGIIVTMGNVTFDSSVKSFDGLIIAGGKIYIENGLTSITSNAELCRSILKELLFDSSDEAQKFLKLFKDYESASSSLDSNADADGYVTIDTIDYTDVVEYSDWMKNVE